MSMIILTRRNAIVSGGGGGGGGAGSPFFSDDFNTGGFGAPLVDNGANDGVFRYSLSADGVVSNSAPIEGTHSLAITYGPNAENTVGSDIQRSYSLGRTLGEFWFEFTWLVPTNYLHRTNGSVTNNKLYAFYPGPSKGGGNSELWVGAEYERTNSTESSFRPLLTRADWNFVGNPTIAGSFKFPSGNRLISSAGPVTPGTPAVIRVHWKAASAPTVDDGVYEIWINGVLYFQVFGRFWNQSTRTVDEPVVKAGYLMGAANSGYSAATTFKLDGLKWYDTNPGW